MKWPYLDPVWWEEDGNWLFLAETKALKDDVTLGSLTLKEGVVYFKDLGKSVRTESAWGVQGLCTS